MSEQLTEGQKAIIRELTELAPPEVKAEGSEAITRWILDLMNAELQRQQLEQEGEKA